MGPKTCAGAVASTQQTTHAWSCAHPSGIAPLAEQGGLWVDGWQQLRVVSCANNCIMKAACCCVLADAGGHADAGGAWRYGWHASDLEQLVRSGMSPMALEQLQRWC